MLIIKIILLLLAAYNLEGVYTIYFTKRWMEPGEEGYFKRKMWLYAIRCIIIFFVFLVLIMYKSEERRKIMISTEGIFILLAILIFIYLYIWLNKNFQIKEITIDEVVTLPLREQQKLLDKERKKLVDLMYEYNNAGYWKGIIRKYYIPNIEKKIRIEKKIKVVESNISLLEKAINEMKV